MATVPDGNTFALTIVSAASPAPSRAFTESLHAAASAKNFFVIVSAPECARSFSFIAMNPRSLFATPMSKSGDLFLGVRAYTAVTDIPTIAIALTSFIMSASYHSHAVAKSLVAE